ncbi:hypothetical protein A2U01_0113556, partial [Trifolium medium]|nr:hypothetical protein [Trifolium medium]
TRNIPRKAAPGAEKAALG